MKNLFKSMMLVAVAAMGFTACSNEAVEEVNPAIEKGFSLTISAEKPALESDTRTEFADGSVIWSANDQIRACYYHSAGTGTWSKYYASTAATIAADGSTATFTKFNPTGKPQGFPLIAGEGTYTFYAGYPSKSGTIGSGTNAPSNGVLSVKVATEQTMSEAGTFDAAADIMVGKATETISGIKDGVNLDLSFNYTRLVAHGCVTLKNFAAEEGEKVLNVTFTAPEDVMLTGSGEVNFVEQTMTALDNNTVTVTLPENTAATENVVVWFCSAPATIASGANLTVTVETTRGTYTRTITANANGIQFLQNRYNTLGINMASAEFVAATVESLKVTGATTAFTTEDEFVFDGTVTATLSNGYEQDVTALATVNSSEVVMTTAGTYPVTVSYGGKETFYEVTVQDASVQTQEVTITFDGGAGQKDVLTWKSAPITVVANKASGDNAPYEHASDKQLRFYTKNTLTFSGANITKIVFNLDSNKTGGLSADGGNYSLSTTTGTWVGSAESVTFTTTSQARINSVTITYSGAGGGGEEPTPDPVYPEAGTAVTVAEFIEYAQTDIEYQLTGVVSNVVNTEYGNFDLTDETGTIYVYGLYSTDGSTNKYWATSGVQEGDTLTIRGKYLYYEKDAKHEVVNAKYISHVAAEEPEDPVTPPTGDNVTYTLQFGSSYNSKSVTSYTDTWAATCNGFTWDISNANNNGNGWNYIKMGRKNVVSTGSIKTNTTMPEAIKTVTMTVDACTTKKINSIKLYVSKANDYSTYVVDPISVTPATGDLVFTIPTPTEDCYYKIEVDCASGSGNGLIQISKVVYAN